MPKLVSGIEVMGKSLWRFQRVSHRPSRRCTPVTATHLLATATLMGTTATIIATTATILATITIATKRNLGPPQRLIALPHV